MITFSTITTLHIYRRKSTFNKIDNSVINQAINKAMTDISTKSQVAAQGAAAPLFPPATAAAGKDANAKADGIGVGESQPDHVYTKIQVYTKKGKRVNRAKVSPAPRRLYSN